MTISASLVKDLREKTGAGMMDCKKALVECKGDFEAAVDWLKVKGLAAAAKKSGRVAAEGLTSVGVDGKTGAVIELNSETDFVSRNELFQELVRQVAYAAIGCKDLETLKTKKLNTGKTVKETVIESVATIGENISLRRTAALTVNDGVIASYVHNAVAENMGKISVLVALESTADKNELMDLGKQLAMHIAASKPAGLNKEDIDPSLIQREKDIFTEQSKASGKPDNIIEKMIEGRIRKFLEEVVLLDQIFVLDNKSKISEILANASKKLGTSVVIKSYVRFELGEGITKEETNFADEVAAITNR